MWGTGKDSKMMRKEMLRHKGEYESLYIYIKLHRQITWETAGTEKHADSGEGYINPEKHAMRQGEHVNHGGEPTYQ